MLYHRNVGISGNEVRRQAGRNLRAFCRNFSQYGLREATVDLTFIRKDPLSSPGGSPTVYTTDERTLIVQGWRLTDEKARTRMAIPSHEDAGEIPVRMVPIILEALL